jgi:hypothetical protein
LAEPRLRGEQRNEAIREGLESLAPGERPRALTVAAGVAVVLGIVNLVAAAAGYGDEGQARDGLVILGVVMLAVAGGLWRVRYWAALGFQIAVSVTSIYAGLSLLVASNLAALALSALVLAASGTMFWLMIRPMARMQAPRSKVDGHG